MICILFESICFFIVSLYKYVYCSIKIFVHMFYIYIVNEKK